MVQEVDITEVEIDGRTFWVRPVGTWVLDARLAKPLFNSEPGDFYFCPLTKSGNQLTIPGKAISRASTRIMQAIKGRTPI